LRAADKVRRAYADKTADWSLSDDVGRGADMGLRARHLEWQAELVLRRAARRRRRQLARELAEYRTAAERDDLLAAVERCPSPGREEVRRLLVSAAVRADFERTPYHLRV
jgi:hypothetical protein